MAIEGSDGLGSVLQTAVIRSISCLHIFMQICNLGAVVHLYLFLPNNGVTAILMKGEAVTSLFQIYARREFIGVV